MTEFPRQFRARARTTQKTPRSPVPETQGGARLSTKTNPLPLLTLAAYTVATSGVQYAPESIGGSVFGGHTTVRLGGEREATDEQAHFPAGV